MQRNISDPSTVTARECLLDSKNPRSTFSEAAWQSGPQMHIDSVLKGSKKLSLSVRSVGRIPGGYVTNHVYTWVDPQGRSVSPPPDLPEHRSATLRRTDSQRRSNMQLLQEGDEKKVNLVLDDGRSLGLMIRGGAEYALGIYITGVDRGSAAECGGLKVPIHWVFNSQLLRFPKYYTQTLTDTCTHSV
ncbi:hypothetical protein UPYG_G00280550 [Umbra pygmaea]|uniref:Whirlin n=1 Tax=Umbra pygmaea TaxID=75934 RepID=A0ABD0W407_UMBPY